MFWPQLTAMFDEDDEMLSRKKVLQGFAALVFLGSMFALPAQADTTVHEINLSESGTRLLNLSIGNVNIVKAVNPTDAPICITIPAYHVRETIPAKDHRNIRLKTVQSMEPYAFYTVGGGSSKMEAVTETHSWSSSNLSLEKIINYSTEYETVNDPEPLYYDNTYYQEPPAQPQPKPVQKRMIRGYW